MTNTMRKITSLLVIMSCVISIFSIPISAQSDEPEGKTRYVSYNYVTGETTIIDADKLECHINSVESNMEVPSVSPQIVIGSDERTMVTDTTATPYKGIGYLYCNFTSTTERGTCTAFASNAVITAAHVVWKKTLNKSADSYIIAFGRNGETSYPYGKITTTPTEVIIPENYLTTQSYNYDYAILLYNTTISDYIFGFKSSVSNGTAVTVTGYPKEVGNTSPIYTQYTASGTISSTSTYTVEYSIDTSGGQSGCPVYNSSNQIVAIHHDRNSGNTANLARKIDSDLFAIMNSIRNGTYQSTSNTETILEK